VLSHTACTVLAHNEQTRAFGAQVVREIINTEARGQWGAGRTLNIIHVPNDAINWPTMMNLCAVF
jgi:hypothetical protein